MCLLFFENSLIRSVQKMEYLSIYIYMYIYLWTGYEGDIKFMVSRDVNYDPTRSLWSYIFIWYDRVSPIIYLISQPVGICSISGADPGILVWRGGRGFFFSKAWSLEATLRPQVGPVGPGGSPGGDRSPRKLLSFSDFRNETETIRKKLFYACGILAVMFCR